MGVPIMPSRGVRHHRRIDPPVAAQPDDGGLHREAGQQHSPTAAEGSPQVTTTPESIAARYADLMCPSGAEPQSLTTMRKAFDDAIREALAPVEAERDAARSILMEAFVLGVGYVADAVVVGDRVSIGVGKFKTIFDLLAAERDAARANLEVIEKDRDRLDWLLQQGLAWRGHQQYDKNWLPGEWLYEACSIGGARNEIDKARRAAEEAAKGNANA